MREIRWTRVGGLAGILYVVIALTAGALTGAAPKATGRAATYQQFFMEKQTQLVVQGWLFPFGVTLLLMFSVAVRQVLKRADGYLSDLFLSAQIVIAALLVATTSLQIAVAQSADTLDSQVLFTIGVHFPAIATTLWGFLTAAAASCYAFCVFRDRVFTRWTAYLALLVSIVCVGSTLGVFVSTGPFSLEGAFGAFAPALSTVAWYLAVSIALLRGKAATDSQLES